MVIMRLKGTNKYYVNGNKISKEALISIFSQILTTEGLEKFSHLLAKQSYVIFTPLDKKNSEACRLCNVKRERDELKTGMAKQESLPF